MDNKEAIEILKMSMDSPFERDLLLGKAVNLAIKALEEKEPEFEIWKPENGEKVWFVGGYGAVDYTYYDLGLAFSYAQGDIFQTEAEAIFEKEKQAIVFRYKNLTKLSWGGEKEIWDGKMRHHYPLRYIGAKKIQTDYTLNRNIGNVYFKTEQSLQDAIAEIGEDNIKKYILEV